MAAYYVYCIDIFQPKKLPFLRKARFESHTPPNAQPRAGAFHSIRVSSTASQYISKTVVSAGYTPSERTRNARSDPHEKPRLLKLSASTA